MINPSNLTTLYFENNDFTLKENSPAFKLGFKQIDIKDVGAKR